ncbi:triose-phosphate isomerase [Mesorhizobium sp. VNQ89]|uniref:triose-phosphate isomerase n=1 Tax=Mesorhizobium quangtriensis TaxID=3157709 RepID=UPI0032B83B35
MTQSPPRWVGTSWKMNKTRAEALAFAEALASAMPGVDAAIQPFIVPPFTCVREVKAALGGTRVKVGAQNMHWEDAGAWTGEISAPMLVDCGLDLVELGHSERRSNFGETDRTVGLKVAAALRHGLVPLVCVGETLAERDAGRADAVLEQQVRGALEFADGGQAAGSILFAYEPVWAIGVNGIPATAAYAGQRHRSIADLTGTILKSRCPVLYGGSVNRDNAAELIVEPGIDGLFIGRAAWDVEGYLDIMRIAAKVINQA